MSIQQIVAFVLIASGALGLAGMRIWQWYKNRPAPTAGSSSAVLNSDAPAPAGVTDYLAMVELTASSASPALWWEYAKKGLTVTSILRSEVQRLTPKPPVPAKPVAPIEAKP